MPTRPGYLDRVGDYPEVEELIRSHKPHPAEGPFLDLRQSPFPGGPFPGDFRMSSLAQNPPPITFTMDRAVSPEGQNLREDSRKACKRVPTGYNFLFLGSRQRHVGTPFPHQTNQVPQFRIQPLGEDSKVLGTKPWTPPAPSNPQDQCR